MDEASDGQIKINLGISVDCICVFIFFRFSGCNAFMCFDLCVQKKRDKMEFQIKFFLPSISARLKYSNEKNSSRHGSEPLGRLS